MVPLARSKSRVSVQTREASETLAASLEVLVGVAVHLEVLKGAGDDPEGLDDAGGDPEGLEGVGMIPRALEVNNDPQGCRRCWNDRDAALVPASAKAQPEHSLKEHSFNT